MTWALTLTAIGIWLFRKPIARVLAPYLPSRAQRHRWLGVAIAAFLMVAALRLAAQMAGW